jgi:hypothetical protein
MNLKRNQHGVSLSGLIMACVVLGTFALLFMKLWPIYNEKMKVDQAMEKLAANPDAGRMSKIAMVNSIMRQFEVNDVRRFSTPELTKTLQIGRKKGSKNKVVTLAYEIRGPLFANLDVVMNYNKVLEFGPTKTD